LGKISHINPSCQETLKQFYKESYTNKGGAIKRYRRLQKHKEEKRQI